MSISSTLRIVIFAVLTLSGVSACASSSNEESTGQYIDDATITTKVNADFVADKVVSAMRIDVTTYKGVVQLSGFANSDTEKHRAQELAESVKGVQSVKNDILLK